MFSLYRVHGRHCDGENCDGENCDGENFDGENFDGENFDGRDHPRRGATLTVAQCVTSPVMATRRPSTIDPDDYVHLAEATRITFVTRGDPRRTGERSLRGSLGRRDRDGATFRGRPSDVRDHVAADLDRDRPTRDTLTRDLQRVDHRFAST